MRKNLYLCTEKTTAFGMMTNKHLTIFLVLILIMPMTIFGENYDSLWKKVQTA